MRNRMYGGVRGRKTKVGEKLLCFPPTRFYFVAGVLILAMVAAIHLRLADKI